MNIDEIKNEISNKISNVNDLKSLNEIKVLYLGKTGIITILQNGIKEAVDKKSYGMMVNDIRNHFNTFVNGRIIKNIEINRAINDAYNTYKHEGFYPIVVINIETDPTLVDVNIHPTKQDIKMSKMDILTDLIYQNSKND